MHGHPATAEPYTTRFESEVTDVNGRMIRLDRTYFHPGGPGVPSDRGRINDIDVSAIRFEDGDVYHELADDPGVRPGQRVLCSIDWDHRMTCMRALTAGYVLLGGCEDVIGSVELLGVDIGDGTVGVDLHVPRPITVNMLAKLDGYLNRSVWESWPISWESMKPSVLPECHRHLGDETGNPSTESAVRVVTIGDENDPSSDGPIRVACNGLHVRNTREIAPVTIIRGSTETAGETRIDVAIGPAAIEHRGREKRAISVLSRSIGMPDADIADVIDHTESGVRGATQERGR